MNHYKTLYKYLSSHPDLVRWLETLDADIAEGLDCTRHGDLSDWYDALEKIPQIPNSFLDIKTGVTIGQENDIDKATQQQLQTQLEALIPWRKGPYNIHGINLDTEWHSDWKWDRLSNEIEPLSNRLVLDVGCGNGYHCWRMLGAGAARVIGIDPSPRFVVQFRAIKRLAGQELPIDVLPLGVEQLPASLQTFDTTFSMGVFYHRRSPMDHLRELKETLRDGGQLVLETLVIDGKLGDVLVPPKRYAMMNNVWFLPSTETLLSWLKKCGFKQARLVDVSTTTIEEQRATHWMRYHSLENFLDPENSELTAEGHPAPKRAIFIATA